MGLAFTPTSTELCFQTFYTHTNSSIHPALSGGIFIAEMWRLGLESPAKMQKSLRLLSFPLRHLETVALQPNSLLKGKDITLPTNFCYSQSYGFSSFPHLQMWELNHKESQVTKNWCFQLVMLEKTLENPLDRMEIKPVNPKGNQPWMFIGRTDSEVVPILWPPYIKSWLIGKDPDDGRHWRQKKEGARVQDG